MYLPIEEEANECYGDHQLTEKYAVNLKHFQSKDFAIIYANSQTGGKYMSFLHTLSHMCIIILSMLPTELI